MQIISLKHSRFPSRIYLKFSDGSLIPFSLDDYVSLRLNKNDELDASQVDTIVRSSLAYLASEFSLRQIAMAPRIASVLLPKLKNYLKRVILKYKYPSSDFDLDAICRQTTDHLESKGLLDQKAYVDYFIRKNRRKSARQLSYLLSSQGIDSSLIPQNLSTGSLDRQKISEFLQKHLSDPSILADFTSRQKLMAKLYRKGFAVSDIKSVIDEVSKNR